MSSNTNEDLVITVENLPFKMTLSSTEMSKIRPKIESSLGLDINISKEKLLNAYIIMLQENIKYEDKFELLNDKLKSALE
jgi:hypothetical protein